MYINRYTISQGIFKERFSQNTSAAIFLVFWLFLIYGDNCGCVPYLHNDNRKSISV